MSDLELKPAIKMTRREAIGRAILLVGGVALGPAACSPPARQGFFSAADMRLLAELCETILPQTDTPGARATNVHGFIDGMMATWASEATRATMRALLERVEREARGRFVGLEPAERLALVQRLDAAAFAVQDRGWIQLKKLVLLGYYSSEAGATQELAYLPVPGEWRPDERVRADTRAWAE